MATRTGARPRTGTKSSNQTARTGVRSGDATQRTGVRRTAKQVRENPQALTEAVVEIEEVALAAHNTSKNVLLYGPPGTGKTVLAGGISHAEGVGSVVFLSTEIEGAVSARVTGSTARLWPAPTWEHAVAGIGKAERELVAGDWLIVDSGTRMQEMYMRWILQRINAASPNRDLDIPAIQDHQKYQNGFKRWYDSIIAMPCNTVLICNSMNAEDAEGEPRVIPLLLGKKGEISDYISAQPGVVLYYSVSRESRENEATGSDIVRRVLAQPYPPWLAKDRYDALGSYWDVGYRDYTAMARMVEAIEKAGNGSPSRPVRAGRRVAKEARTEAASASDVRNERRARGGSQAPSRTTGPRTRGRKVGNSA
jgi:AAA domain